MSEVAILFKYIYSVLIDLHTMTQVQLRFVQFFMLYKDSWINTIIKQFPFFPHHLLNFSLRCFLCAFFFCIAAPNTEAICHYFHISLNNKNDRKLTIKGVIKFLFSANYSARQNASCALSQTCLLTRGNNYHNLQRPKKRTLFQDWLWVKRTSRACLE